MNPINRLRNLVLILLAFILAFVTTQPVQAQAQTFTITVSGTGTVAGEPDIAFAKIGIEVFNTNLNTAVTSAAKSLSDITNAMAAQGVALTDVQQSDLVVEPRDRSVGGTGAPVGSFIFRVRRTVRVTFRDLSKLEATLNAAIGAGANVVDNFAYSVANVAELEKAARKRAVESATERAKQLAESLGAAVGEAIIIAEPAGLISVPFSAFGGDLRGANIEKNTVPATGQFIVSVQVQVTFTLRASRS